jgi:hypothetical protein
MDDYRKKIIDGVLNHPMYKAVSKDLPDDQRKKIEEILGGYVDQFSMNLIRTFSSAARAQSKQLEIPSGSVITKENG